MRVVLVAFVGVFCKGRGRRARGKTQEARERCPYSLACFLGVVSLPTPHTVCWSAWLPVTTYDTTNPHPIHPRPPPSPHRAPVHSYRHTRRQVKAALGVEVEQLFDSFQATPLASGSIAQVHKATLKPDAYRQYIQQPPTLPQQPHHPAAAAAAEQQVVVVKVCHPNVAEHIRLDFKLVALLSAAASRLPVLRGLPLRESVAQFSHTMTAQTDLRVEAVHALRFHNNFAGRWVGAGAVRWLCPLRARMLAPTSLCTRQRVELNDLQLSRCMCTVCILYGWVGMTRTSSMRPALSPLDPCLCLPLSLPLPCLSNRRCAVECEHPSPHPWPCVQHCAGGEL